MIYSYFSYAILLVSGYYIWRVSRLSNFYSVYLSLAVFFIYMLYVFPLSIILKNGGFFIGAWHSATERDAAFGFVGLVLFLFGFFLSLYGIKGRLSSESVRGRSPVYSKCRDLLLWALLISVIVILVYQIESPERALHHYAVRRGEVEGDHIQHFLQIILRSVAYALLLVLIERRQRLMFYLFWLVMVVHAFNSSIGRFSLILLLSLPIVDLFFRRRPGRAALALIIMLPIFVPLLVNLKSFIYHVVILGDIPNVGDYYSSSVSTQLLIGNFGHPAYSFLNAPRLVSDIGYMYFYDIINGFLFYAKLFGLNVSDSLTYWNTENLIGIHESIIPPGYLAFGYVQLGYLGVAISGAIYAFIARLAKFLLDKSRITSSVGLFYFAMMASNTFYQGEIRVMILTFLIPLITVACLCRFFQGKFV